jgi:hypothetical protein
LLSAEVAERAGSAAREPLLPEDRRIICNDPDSKRFDFLWPVLQRI